MLVKNYIIPKPFTIKDIEYKIVTFLPDQSLKQEIYSGPASFEVQQSDIWTDNVQSSSSTASGTRTGYWKGTDETPPLSRGGKKKEVKFMLIHVSLNSIVRWGKKGLSGKWMCYQFSEWSDFLSEYEPKQAVQQYNNNGRYLWPNNG